MRGSIPVSGAETSGFGGETMCHEIGLGDARIIVDAGSGIRRLGLELAQAGPCRIHILLTHLHLDHVIGLTAFAPLFEPGFDITLYGHDLPDQPLEHAIGRLFGEPLFPVSFEALPSKPACVGFKAGDRLEIDGHRVATTRLNHGAGATGYRFDHGGHRLAIITDHEHAPEGPDADLADFCAGADLMAYDAMWDETTDYARHAGWGHSTWQAGVALAKLAGARRLACVHHAPQATDARLLEREARLRARMPQSFFARQDDIVSFP